MTEFEALLERYDYPISEESIALTPAEPRDSSKLLIYDRKTATTRQDIFSNIAKYLPAGALLVFNDTKVIPARLPGKISTGGKVELLCTKFDGEAFAALCERFLPIGERVTFTDTASAIVLDKTGSEYSLELHGETDLKSLLIANGTTPLPPYLKRSPLSESERREKYQAIFAKHDGSIAAPTASLHFTDEVLQDITQSGIQTAYVTLHVNLGTFMPLTPEALANNQLHEEKFEIPDETITAIQDAKREGRPVIAVGTTPLRALESAFGGAEGSTRLFIQEGYVFKVVDGLVTNFHVPKSSLMMLVAALIGREKLLSLYRYALEHQFRFFSFGDAMLIE